MMLPAHHQQHDETTNPGMVRGAAGARRAPGHARFHTQQRADDGRAFIPSHGNVVGPLLGMVPRLAEKMPPSLETVRHSLCLTQPPVATGWGGSPNSAPATSSNRSATPPSAQAGFPSSCAVENGPFPPSHSPPCLLLPAGAGARFPPPLLTVTAGARMSLPRLFFSACRRTIRTTESAPFLTMAR